MSTNFNKNYTGYVTTIVKGTHQILSKSNTIKMGSGIFKDRHFRGKLDRKWAWPIGINGDLLSTLPKICTHIICFFKQFFLFSIGNTYTFYTNGAHHSV